jgi:hypothetical protein
VWAAASAERSGGVIAPADVVDSGAGHEADGAAVVVEGAAVAGVDGGVDAVGAGDRLARNSKTCPSFNLNRRSDMNIRRAALLLILTFAIAGCASTARYFVAQQAIQPLATTPGSLPEPIKDHVQVRCVLPDGKDNCIYAGIYYDPSFVFATLDKPQRDAFAYLAVNVANQNCDWFIDRVFGNRTGINSIRDAIKNLMTGAAALTAKPSPALSAGLSVANLFADSTVKSLDANQFANQTFEALQSAIEKSRQDKQKEISDRLAKTPAEYPIGALVDDLQEYSGLCTLPSAFKSLKDITTQSAGAAKTDQKAATNKLFNVQ